MMRSLVAALSLAFLLAIPSTAEARHHKQSDAHRQHHARSAHHVHHVRHARYNDDRPSAWCGWFMARRIYGHDVRRLWLAANWAREGRAVGGPIEGAIGVAAHHVVQVLKVLGPGRILAISGNDSHAVRTRERSTRGIFAWRVV